MARRGAALAEQSRVDEALPVVERAVTTFEDLTAAGQDAAEDLESARQLREQLSRPAAELPPDEGAG